MNKTLCFLRSDRRVGRSSAFTLVELLVVIGVIALLLAILLPGLAAARGAARTVACAANLHDLGVAVAARAAERQGYAPAAGVLYLPTPSAGGAGLGAPLAPVLNDSARRRYDYRETDPTGPFALRELLAEPAGLLSAPGTFRCPGVTDPEAGVRTLLAYRFEGTGYQSANAETPPSDYAVNSFVFGRVRRGGDEGVGGTWTVPGQLSAVREPSRTVALGDARHDLPFAWQPAPSDPASTVGPQLDLDRHAAKNNLLFVDGHVSPVTDGSSDWQDVTFND